MERSKINTFGIVFQSFCVGANFCNLILTGGLTALFGLLLSILSLTLFLIDYDYNF